MAKLTLFRQSQVLILCLFSITTVSGQLFTLSNWGPTANPFFKTWTVGHAKHVINPEPAPATTFVTSIRSVALAIPTNTAEVMTRHGPEKSDHGTLSMRYKRKQTMPNNKGTSTWTIDPATIHLSSTAVGWRSEDYTELTVMPSDTTTTRNTGSMTKQPTMTVATQTPQIQVRPDSTTTKGFKSSKTQVVQETLSDLLDILDRKDKYHSLKRGLGCRTLGINCQRTTREACKWRSDILHGSEPCEPAPKAKTASARGLIQEIAQTVKLYKKSMNNPSITHDKGVKARVIGSSDNITQFISNPYVPPGLILEFDDYTSVPTHSEDLTRPNSPPKDDDEHNQVFNSSIHEPPSSPWESFPNFWYKPTCETSAGSPYVEDLIVAAKNLKPLLTEHCRHYPIQNAVNHTCTEISLYKSAAIAICSRTYPSQMRCYPLSLRVEKLVHTCKDKIDGPGKLEKAGGFWHGGNDIISRNMDFRLAIYWNRFWVDDQREQELRL